MSETFGAEHEWADISLDVVLPEGYGRDPKDYTIVNSNGIANDPKGVTYRLGGEINTPPTRNPLGQADCLDRLRELNPKAKVNYRSNLHIHVRRPGLASDLALLKRVQAYIHETMPYVFPYVEPIPKPTLMDYRGRVHEYEGAMRRFRRREVSHHSLLTPNRLKRQMVANTVEDFFKAEVPRDKRGNPLWHAQARLCVSLRQLLQTDTVEFRHFPGTLDRKELLYCVEWCANYLEAAIAGTSIGVLLGKIDCRRFPKFPDYKHWQEVRYRATCLDGSNPRETILKNIKLIEAGEFDDKGVIRI